MNLYGYGFGNPANLTDRLGLMASNCSEKLTWDEALQQWIVQVNCAPAGGGSPTNPNGTDPDDPDRPDGFDDGHGEGGRGGGCKRGDPNCKEPEPECKPGDPNCGPPNIPPEEDSKAKRWLNRTTTCAARYGFSNTVRGFAGETAGNVTSVLEVAGPLSFGADVAAMTARSSFAHVYTPEDYASGMNWGFRRMSHAAGSRSLQRTLTGFGNKATPVLAVVGVFTLGYNATIELQCATGVLQ